MEWDWQSDRSLTDVCVPAGGEKQWRETNQSGATRVESARRCERAICCMMEKSLGNERFALSSPDTVWLAFPSPARADTKFVCVCRAGQQTASVYLRLASWESAGQVAFNEAP